MTILKESLQKDRKPEDFIDNQAEETEKKDAEKEASSSDINDVFTAESEDEGDEDILAACINMGMQTNRWVFMDFSFIFILILYVILGSIRFNLRYRQMRPLFTINCLFPTINIRQKVLLAAEYLYHIIVV